jgi:hypothetical protein
MAEGRKMNEFTDVTKLLIVLFSISFCFLAKFSDRGEYHRSLAAEENA